MKKVSAEANVKLSLAKLKDKEVLENLLSLYLHDLSEYVNDLHINGEGKFIYEGLDLYFIEEDLEAYFIYKEEDIIGFILVNKGKYTYESTDYMINEFFILKKYRKLGLANRAIKMFFKDNLGVYIISQLKNNKKAYTFWKNLYERENIRYEEVEEEFQGLRTYSQIFTLIK